VNATLLTFGTVLQVMGVLSVAVGIRNVRRDFNFGPGMIGAAALKGRRLHQRISSALKRLLGVTPSPVTIPASAQGTSGTAGVAGAIYTPAKFPEDHDLQISWLKSRVDLLQESTRLLTERVGSLDDNAATDRNQNKSEHERIINNFNERIRTFATGGLRLQTWGVALLLAGIVLSGVGALTT